MNIAEDKFSFISATFLVASSAASKINSQRRIPGIGCCSGHVSAEGILGAPPQRWTWLLRPRPSSSTGPAPRPLGSCSLTSPGAPPDHPPTLSRHCPSVCKHSRMHLRPRALAQHACAAQVPKHSTHEVAHSATSRSKIMHSPEQ